MIITRLLCILSTPPSCQINDGKLEFFPLLVALILGKEEDETAHQLEELKTMVSDVLDRFKKEVRMCVHAGVVGGVWRNSRQEPKRDVYLCLCNGQWTIA